ncbi:MAG: DUF4170 domain-containing protein [Parvibaculales bacterium]
MNKQEKLYLVFGGKLKDPQSGAFISNKGFDIVGIYTNEEDATKIWREYSQANVDDALMRYMLIPIEVS